MKKILTTLVLLLFTASTAFGSVFGPRLITATKGKAKPERFVFSASVTNEDNCTLNLSQWQGAKVSAIVDLNGIELVNRKTKFTDGKIEMPIDLINGENVITITALGKKGVSLRTEITKVSPPSTFVTVHTATRAAGTMVPGAEVRLTLFDGTVLTTVTGADGFCFFENIPGQGAALLEARIPDGLVSSTAVSLRTTKGAVVGDLPPLSMPGTGTVTGSVMTDDGIPLKVTVSLVFPSTKYTAATMANDDGTFVFEGLPLDGYYFVSVKGSGVLRSGSGQGLLDELHTTSSTSITREVICPCNDTLLNGNFEQNMFGWRGSGERGILWKPNYFLDDNSDEKCRTQEKPVTASLAPLKKTKTGYCGYSDTTKFLMPSIMKSDLDFPGPYCGTACTNESANATIAQKFRIHSDKAILNFKWIFCSLEWGYYKTWSHHDAFSIKLETMDETIQIASGDVNSLPMEDLPISFGFAGVSSVQEESIVIEDQAGQFVDLVFTVTAAGFADDPLDSFVALADAEIIDDGNLVHHSNGVWFLGQYTGDLVEFQTGNILKFVLTNPSFPGTTIDMKEVTTGQSIFKILPPYWTTEVTFSKPCEGPTDWKFLIHTESPANNVVKWEALSNWIP